MWFSRECWYCGNKLLGKGNRFPSKNRISIDHQMPLSRGGEGGNNRVISCADCNNLKGSLTLEEFRAVMAVRHGKLKNVDFPFHGEQFVFSPLGAVKRMSEPRSSNNSNTCLSEAIHWLSQAKAANPKLTDEIDELIETVGDIAQNEAMRKFAANTTQAERAVSHDCNAGR